MASIINASSTGSGGIVQTADASGILQLQANGTVALTVNSNASLTASNTGSGITFASSAGSGIRVYGAAGTNQWDIYGNGANLRFSDNTGGGRIVIDGTASVGTTFGVGGATPAASGSGVTFPATQSASSDANTLDDYEEGTWTPTIGTASGTVTLGTTGMRYTKVGNIVTISGYLTVSSVSAPSGLTYISGFPFVPYSYPGNGSNFPYTFYNGASTVSAGYFPWGYTSAGNNGAYLRLSQGGSGLTEMGAFFKASMELWINCTYQVA
jgi:hypothetical protein